MTKIFRDALTALTAAALLLFAACAAPPAPGGEGGEPAGAKTETETPEVPGIPEAEEMPAAPEELAKGDPAPDFTAETMDGETVGLSALRGKIVLISFWATWSAASVGELSEIERLYQAYAGEDFEVIAVNCAEPRDTVAQFLSERDFTFPVVPDELGGISASYPTAGIPYTVIVGRDGAVGQTVLGGRNYDQFLSMIDGLMEAS